VKDLESRLWTGSLSRAGGLLLALLLVVAFAFLVIQVTQEGVITRFDISFAQAVNDAVWGSRALVGLALVVSFLGSPAWFYGVIGVAAIYFWRRGDRDVVLFLVGTNAFGGLIDTLVKSAIDRPRPQLEHPVAEALGMSFPSGHAMATTVGYGSLLVCFLLMIPSGWRKWVVAAYLVAIVLVATSRVVLGVHYVSDVVGGFVLGCAWLIACVALLHTNRTFTS